MKNSYQQRGKSFLEAILAGVGIGAVLAVLMAAIIGSFFPDFFF
jgi:uncharacterized membrane protein